MDTEAIVAKYKKQQEQRSAINKRYRETHKASTNQHSRNYYNNHKEDKEWLDARREKQRVYQKARYQRLKEAQKNE